LNDLIGIKDLSLLLYMIVTLFDNFELRFFEQDSFHLIDDVVEEGVGFHLIVFLLYKLRRIMTRG